MRGIVAIVIAVVLLCAPFSIEAATKKHRRVHARSARRAKTPAPRFKIVNGQRVPVLNARAGIVLNADTGDVIWSSNEDALRPIASITKVMTALVAYEDVDVPLYDKIRIVRTDTFRASTTRLRTGDVVTKDDLLHLLLIASDNAAARALARTSSYGYAGFIERMNMKAKELDLAQTSYADSSGLLATNRSTPADQAKLLVHVAENAYITSIMQFMNYTVTTPARKIWAHTTNRLLRDPSLDIVAAKTGYTSRAGYCFATFVNHVGKRLAVVVLGARSNVGRFRATKRLLDWLDTTHP